MSVVLKANDGPLRDYLRLEPQRQAEGLRLFQEEGSILAMEELRSNVPVRSGSLRESVSREILPDGFTVYPSAKYAGFVDQGSRPHTIFPKSGRFCGLRTSGAPRSSLGRLSILGFLVVSLCSGQLRICVTA